MKTEVERIVRENSVVVVYDDGSRETFDLDPAPHNVVADTSPSLEKGHVFTEKELKEGGYDD